MTKSKQILIEDNKSIKNILVQVNLEKSSVTVISNFSAWGDLAFLMEALGITAEQCVKEGIERGQVNEEIQNYLKSVLSENKMLID